jgi:hypothetical protein
MAQSGGNFLDQFIRMTTAGGGKIATVAPMGVKGYLIHKLNLTSGEENLFLDSMIGLLDDIGNLSAFYQNARRRLRITDRILRKNAGTVQSLFQLSFFSDWMQQLVQARSGETNLLTIVTLLLNIIYHEYVSVLAPPFIEAETIKRDKLGNPIRKKDNKGSMRHIETTPENIIGNFVFKPHIYTLPPPSCNVLFPNMIEGIEYHRNFMEENTRMTLTPQVMNVDRQKGTSLGFLKLKVFKRPQELDNFFSLITTTRGSEQVIEKRPSIAKYGDGVGQSAQVQEFEFMTNEERFKGINPAFQGLAPAPAILSLQNQGKKNSSGNPEGGAPRYLHNVASYEYYMNKFVSRQFNVTGPYNIRPIAGYPLLILDDSDANMNMVAYLQGISHTLHASTGSSTSYMLTLPREVDEIDLNRPKLNEVTGNFAYKTVNGERVFEFDKMFDSAHQPPLPDWFDDDFKTIGKLTDLYKSLFGKDVKSSEDIRTSSFAAEEKNSKNVSAVIGNKETNSIFRQAVKLILEDYNMAKATDNEFSFSSTYTKRSFTSMFNAFKFLGALPKNFTKDTIPIADTDYIGNGDYKSYTNAEVDKTGQSTDTSSSGFAIYDGRPIAHPYEMKLYNDSVIKAKKDNEKATTGKNKRTMTAAEQAPTGLGVEDQTFKPLSYPLSEDQIIKARRSIINQYRNELKNKRGFRG